MNLEKLKKYYANIQGYTEASDNLNHFSAGFDAAMSHTKLTLLQGIDGLKLKSDEFKKLEAAVKAFNGIE